jgi:hypothetical protein
LSKKSTRPEVSQPEDYLLPKEIDVVDVELQVSGVKRYGEWYVIGEL